MYSYPANNKISSPDAKLWDILSISSIIFSMLIFLLQWRQLPFFLDMYYHLSTAKGFEAAGGLVLHNFWEYAPSGAPHLYPPLIHIIILGMLKIGVSGIDSVRILSCSVPVFFLYILWHTVKNILNKRIAFFTIYLCLCSSLFMTSLSFTPAATIAMALFLLGVSSIYHNRLITSVLLFGLVFYTHTGIAVILIIFILLLKTSRIINRRELIKLIFFTLLIGSPWFIHLLNNIKAISWNNSAQMALRLYPVIIIFFITGSFRAFKNINRYKIFIIFLLSLLPMGILYPFRLISSQGMTGLIIFAGIGLDYSYKTLCDILSKKDPAKKYMSFSLAVILLYLIFFSPSISFFKKNIHFNPSDSQLTSIFEGKERKPEYVTSTGIYNDLFFKRLALEVNKHTDSGQPIWSNYRYITAILWCITQRPAVSHTLLEISLKNETLNLDRACLLIVIDKPGGELKRVQKRTGHDFYIAENFKHGGVNIYLLKNKRRHINYTSANIKPVITARYLFIMLFIYMIAITLSCRHKK